MESQHMDNFTKTENSEVHFQSSDTSRNTEDSSLPSTSTHKHVATRRNVRPIRPVEDVIDDHTDYYYSVFRTKRSALVAKATDRIIELAKPRPRIDYNTKPFPFEVARSALTVKPNARTKRLAKPIIRKEM